MFFLLILLKIEFNTNRLVILKFAEGSRSLQPFAAPHWILRIEG